MSRRHSGKCRSNSEGNGSARKAARSAGARRDRQDVEGTPAQRDGVDAVMQVEEINRPVAEEGHAACPDSIYVFRVFLMVPSRADNLMHGRTPAIHKRAGSQETVGGTRGVADEKRCFTKGRKAASKKCQLWVVSWRAACPD